MYGLRTARRAQASFNTCISGVQRPAATHVGKSPDCRKLGLGVLEISIAAGTGTDVMAGGAGAAVPAADVYQVILSYTCICL